VNVTISYRGPAILQLKGRTCIADHAGLRHLAPWPPTKIKEKFTHSSTQLIVSSDQICNSCKTLKVYISAVVTLTGMLPYETTLLMRRRHFTTCALTLAHWKDRTKKEQNMYKTTKMNVLYMHVSYCNITI